MCQKFDFIKKDYELSQNLAFFFWWIVVYKLDFYGFVKWIGWIFV
ncbi:hypothetical protein [Helicobacter sp. 23-1045]